MEFPKPYSLSGAKLRGEFFSSPGQNAQDINDLFFNLIYTNTPPKTRILDIGTGNAFVLEQLAKRYPFHFGKLVGIDISEEMLSNARERVSNLDIALQQGDNLNLPFENSSFGAVVAKNVTNFSEFEIYRVLAEKGKFFFREYGSNKGLEEIATMFRDRLIRCSSAEDYVARFKSAGFRNIILKTFKLNRSYSFEEISKVVKMFPFIKDFNQNDLKKIKSLFGDGDRINITSDPIILMGEK